MFDSYRNGKFLFYHENDSYCKPISIVRGIGESLSTWGNQRGSLGYRDPG